MNLSKAQCQQLATKGSELFEQFNNDMAVNKDCWIEEFVLCMQGYLKKIIKMQQTGLKDEIGHINLSLLRTKLLSREYHVRLDAYNDQWYLDRVECTGIYEVRHFYGRLAEFADLLEKMRKESFVGLPFGEINDRFFHESRRYLVTVSEFLRDAIKKVLKTKEYQELKRAPIFQIYFGEFQDALMIVYKEDHEPKEAKKVKRHLESKKEVYTYELYDNLDLSKGDFENLNITHSSFNSCNFVMSTWQDSKILSCEFKSSFFQHTNFSFTHIVQSDFSDATLEFVNFKGAKLRNVTFKNATLINIDFSKALILEEINFENVTLVDTKIPESSKEVHL